MDVVIRNLEQELKTRVGFERDAVEVWAEVYIKTLQHYKETRMNVVVITGGQQGLQLPHYHKQGFDFFVVLQGQGWLQTADLVDGCVTEQGWQRRRLAGNDSYAIEPNRAHCLLNDGADDLVFLNVSPAEHMSTDYFVLNGVDPESLRTT